MADVVREDKPVRKADKNATVREYEESVIRQAGEIKARRELEDNILKVGEELRAEREKDIDQDELERRKENETKKAEEFRVAGSLEDKDKDKDKDKPLVKDDEPKVISPAYKKDKA